MVKKIYEKNMDGWMDRKNIMKKRWMVGWIKKSMDGWMDRKKYYEKIVWMVGRIKKYEKIDGWLDG